ncbi:MAG: ribosomal protein S18-alanine N-acetyltransferase [Eubacteriales bacterium]|nr:ribosomal protein S18-alanine N-acetyltransferase [Eubacteriales bacterium]
MVLREMLVEDLEQVLEIENAVFSVPWTREGFFTYLTKENAMFLVVEEKGRILGYCGLLMVLDEGDVTNVAVREERRREGIGGFLVGGMIRLARQQGIKIIHLEVRKGNCTAIRLYQRLGFRRDGLRKGYYTSPPEDAVLMSLYEEDDSPKNGD